MGNARSVHHASAVAAIALLSGAAGCQFVPGTAQYETDRAKSLVAAHFDDPAAVQFSGLAYFPESPALCGYVDAPRLDGMMAGPRKFIASKGRVLLYPADPGVGVDFHQAIKGSIAEVNFLSAEIEFCSELPADRMPRGELPE